MLNLFLRKITTCLNEKIIISHPETKYKKEIIIHDLIHKILSQIQNSEELITLCNWEAYFSGSYLMDQKYVNDKDIKFIFLAKDCNKISRINELVYKIARDCLIQNFLDERVSGLCRSLKDIGALKDNYIFFKNTLLSTIILQGNEETLPLDLSFIFITEKTSYLSHLTSYDSLYIPLTAHPKGLGSFNVNEFSLCTREQESLDSILAKIQDKVITTTKRDWDPENVNFFELGRYFIWIIEGCREPDNILFPCFLEGSLRKNQPNDLWKNLSQFVVEKRDKIEHYSFFLMANYLFHVPKELAKNWLEENKEQFQNCVHKCVKNNNQDIDLNLDQDVLFLLSCHLPRHAKKVSIVTHLQQLHLQCFISLSDLDFAVLIPIPQQENAFYQWVVNLAGAPEMHELLFQIMSHLSKEEQKKFSRQFIENALVNVDQGHLLMFKKYLGQTSDVIEWLVDRFKKKEEEKFFLILEFANNGHLLCEILRQLIPYLDSSSNTFWKRIVPQIEQNISQAHPWRSLSIRLVSEVPSCPVECLETFCTNSGIVVNHHFNITPNHFPKLLDTVEKQWGFISKLSLIFNEPSYLFEFYNYQIPREKIEDYKLKLNGAQKIKTERILIRIIEEIQSQIERNNLKEAYKLCSLLPHLNGKQEFIEPIILRLFAISPEDLMDEGVELMVQMHPKLVKECVDLLKAPYMRNSLEKRLPSKFPINRLLYAILSNNSGYLNLMIEKLDVCVSLFGENVIHLIDPHLLKLSEKAKEELMTACSQLPESFIPIGRSIAEKIGPIKWDQKWDLNDLKNAARLILNYENNPALRQKCIDGVLKTIQEISLGNFKSLGSILDVPFSKLVKENFFEEFLIVVEKQMGKFSKNEIDEIASFLNSIDIDRYEHLDIRKREFLREFAFVLIKRLKKGDSLSNQFIEILFRDLESCEKAHTVYLPIFNKICNHYCLSSDGEAADLRLMQNFLLTVRDKHKQLFLADYAFDILKILLKWNLQIDAKKWIKEWTGQENGYSNETIESFYYNNWKFLQLVNPLELLEEFDFILTLNVIKEYERKSSNPLISRCKSELRDACLLSKNGKNLLKRQMVELYLSLDSKTHTEEDLKELLTYCLLPLLKLPEKEYNLDQEFFDRFISYFLAMKARMPLSQVNYECIQVLALLSKKFQSEEQSVQYFSHLIPSLVPKSEDLSQIIVFNNFFKDFEDLDQINIPEISKWVDYVIHMHKKTRDPAICKASSFLTSVCINSQQYELADVLMARVHVDRIQRFIDNESLDITQDFIIYLEYLLTPSDGRILETNKILEMLGALKRREHEAGVPKYSDFIHAIVQSVQNIIRSETTNPKLYDKIMSIVTFTMKIDDQAYRDDLLELAYFSYMCPWDHFSFTLFLEFIAAFLKKKNHMVNEHFLIWKHPIPLKTIFKKIENNFLESNLIEAPQSLKQAVRSYVLFAYNIHVINQTEETFNQMVQCLQKIMKEKNQWLGFSLLPLLKQNPQSINEFQRMIDATDLPVNLKEENKGNLVFLISHGILILDLGSDGLNFLQN